MAFQTELTPGSGYGSIYVDSLVWGNQWSSSPSYFGRFSVEAPVTVQYEFFGDDAVYSGYKFYSWSPRQISQFSEALNTFENICNLRFSASTGLTDLYFLQLDATFFGGTSILGVCETPDAKSDPNFGLFNRSASEWNDLRPGTTGFYVLIHELGHGLGLAHPHDGGTGDNPTKFPGVTNAWSLGLNQMNQGIWTMMSYNYDPSWLEHQSTNGYGHSMTPMALDVAALQAIYGANTSYRTGSDIYQLPQSNSSGTGWSCIWDAGGVDTITNSGSNLPCTIDLNAAPLAGANAAGFVSWANGIVGGFTIANGVVIERAVGGLANDVLIGNDASNEMGASYGDDLMIGGAGFDTLYGGRGNDQLRGGGNGDLIFGGDGDDLIRGGSGLDQINGGDGNDTVYGGRGADTLSGGSGLDVFVFDLSTAVAEQIDLIMDYESGIDQIWLSVGNLTISPANALGQLLGWSSQLNYDASTGTIYYDNSGNGINPIAIVSLSAGNGAGSIEPNDLWIVS